MRCSARSHRGRQANQSGGTWASVALCVACAAAIVVPSIATAEGQADDSSQFRHVMVAAGDTLWSLALDATPEGYSTRDTLTAIMKANGLDGVDVAEGDVLVVPDIGEARTAAR